jgi:hypothetical protein
LHKLVDVLAVQVDKLEMRILPVCAPHEVGDIHVEPFISTVPLAGVVDNEILRLKYLAEKLITITESVEL